MNVETVLRLASGVLGVMTGLALFGKLDEIKQVNMAIYNNQLALAGYDPATGKKAQPEKYQVFGSVGE